MCNIFENDSIYFFQILYFFYANVFVYKLLKIVNFQYSIKLLKIYNQHIMIVFLRVSGCITIKIKLPWDDSEFGFFCRNSNLW